MRLRLALIFAYKPVLAMMILIPFSSQQSCHKLPTLHLRSLRYKKQ
jgi:hypothetical protein